MKGIIGTPMVVHSKFKTEKDYWRWVNLKNKPTKKKNTTKHYRYQRDGEWVDVYVKED